MVHLSLISGFFQDILQTSDVMPLHKKPPLSKYDMNKFKDQCQTKTLYRKSFKETIYQYESAYKKFHSTETALLKVETDIILNMDEGRVNALILLDLSAAFDTLDHSSITNLLSTWYGIAYLSDRKQKVKLMDCLSSLHSFHHCFYDHRLRLNLICWDLAQSARNGS